MASDPAPPARPAAQKAVTAPTPPAAPQPLPKSVNVSHWKEDLAHNDWCPGCVLPETLVFTNPGVQRIDTVEVGQRVLTATGGYGRVAEVMKHRHTGTMYRLLPKGFSGFTVTPDHPVLAVPRPRRHGHNEAFRPAYYEADRLRPGDYVAFPVPDGFEDLHDIPLGGPRAGMDRRSGDLPELVPLTTEFLRLAGYYLSEGSVHRREIFFTFHSREDAYARDVARAIGRVFHLEATFRERPRKHTLETCVASSRLARFFAERFGTGAAHKTVPHELMRLPPRKQRALLRGLWRGDGWVRVDQRRANYRTVSRVLAEQVKVLLLRQGVVPTMTRDAPRPGHREAFTVNVVHDEDFAQLAKVLGFQLPARFEASGAGHRTVLRDGYAFLPLRKIETFPYRGMVYNLVVEGDPSYVTPGSAVHNCGDFGILNAVQMALAETGKANHEVAVFSGIGCSGKISHFVRSYGVHTLHGRVLAFAAGAKVTNPELEVVAIGGDGDGLGIGAGHFVGAGRRNLDMLYMIHDNGVYGLTKGQASPTLPGGAKPKSLPAPNINNAVNPLALALSVGYTWVGRGYAYDIKNLKELIKAGMAHKGMAFLDVFQPCPTYNNINTKEWYAGQDRPDKQPRVYRLAEAGYDGKVRNPADAQEVAEKQGAAFLRSQESEKLGLGVFYEIDLPTLGDKLGKAIPGYAQAPPARQKILLDGGRPGFDVTGIMDEYSLKNF